MASSTQTRALTGAEKVAVLLLALGKPRATNILKCFDAEELRLITRSAADLRPVAGSDLEVLVEEFANKFSSGVNFVGTVKEVESLLADVMTEDKIAEFMSDSQSDEEQIWQSLSRIKDDVLRSYLLKEHPQTVALILSRIDAACAAKIIASLPAEVQNGLLCRMLGIKRVAEDTLRVLEGVLREDLNASASSAFGADTHAGIADILNKLDKRQSEEALINIAKVRPDDAKALKNLLFTFEDLVMLEPKARMMIFDQIPIERVVLALNGTDAAFQAIILSALSARSRRMVEAELQGGNTASARDVAEARRTIVDTVLGLTAQGRIQLQAPNHANERIA